MIDKLSGLLTGRVFSGGRPAGLSYRYFARKIDADLGPDGSGHCILFSSPEGVGITSDVLVKLAQTFQGELGRTVLVVDATLCVDGVGSHAGNDGRPGVVDILYGGKSAEGLVVNTRFRDVYVLPSGKNPAESTARLDPARIAALLDGLRQKYDYVLVQAGSLLGDTRYLPFAQAVDMNVLVAIDGKTFSDDIEQAKKVLKDLGDGDVRLVLIKQ